MFSQRRKNCTFVRVIACIIIVCFASTLPVPYASANILPGVLGLPAPGIMVALSPSFTPPIVAGITLHPDDPLQFDFIIDTGDDNLKGEALKKESKKLINYFMAALTVPEDEMWVNLSPYERDRIIAQGLSETELGRDMLAQDYILKQLTASLMYPEEKLGNKYWKQVYEKAKDLYGTAVIPTDTFNKIWIVPQKAEIYVHGRSVFVADSRLKVILEEDYVAMRQMQDTRHKTQDVILGSGVLGHESPEDSKTISSQIIREIILPEIEREVNEGKNFAPLRQMYHSLILASWYKKNLKKSVLGQVYADQNKVAGIDIEDKQAKEKIYNQYIEAFKKGVYNYIREDVDEDTGEMIPRKYFSGGANFAMLSSETIDDTNGLSSTDWLLERKRSQKVRVVTQANLSLPNQAMLAGRRVSIDGATGWVGSYLSQWLADRGGYKIDALARRDSAGISSIPSHKSVLVTVDDILNIELMRERVKSSVAYFDFAAWSKIPGQEEPTDAVKIKVNVLAPLYRMLLTHQYGKRFIFPSSSTVYRLHSGSKEGLLKENDLKLDDVLEQFVQTAADRFVAYVQAVLDGRQSQADDSMIEQFLEQHPLPVSGGNIYPLGKLIVERAARQFENVLVLRFPEAYGPLEMTQKAIPKMFAAIAQKDEGIEVRDDVKQYIDIRDVMKILQAAIDVDVEKDKRIINVPGPEAIATASRNPGETTVASLIRDITGSEITFNIVPGLENPLMDSSRLKEQFGFVPEIKMQEGLQSTYSWWKEQNEASKDPAMLAGDIKPNELYAKLQKLVPDNPNRHGRMPTGFHVQVSLRMVRSGVFGPRNLNLADSIRYALGRFRVETRFSPAIADLLKEGYINAIIEKQKQQGQTIDRDKALRLVNIEAEKGAKIAIRDEIIRGVARRLKKISEQDSSKPAYVFIHRIRSRPKIILDDAQDVFDELVSKGFLRQDSTQPTRYLPGDKGRDDGTQLLTEYGYTTNQAMLATDANWQDEPDVVVIKVNNRTQLGDEVTQQMILDDYKDRYGIQADSSHLHTQPASEESDEDTRFIQVGGESSRMPLQSYLINVFSTPSDMEALITPSVDAMMYEAILEAYRANDPSSQAVLNAGDLKLHRGESGRARGQTQIVTINGTNESYIIKPAVKRLTKHEITRSQRASRQNLGPQVVFSAILKRRGADGQEDGVIVERYYPNTSIRERGPELNSQEQKYFGQQLAEKIFSMFDLQREDIVTHAFDDTPTHLRVIGKGRDVNVLFIDWGLEKHITESNRAYVLEGHITDIIGSMNFLSQRPTTLTHFLTRLMELAEGRSQEELLFYQGIYRRVREKLTGEKARHVSLTHSALREKHIALFAEFDAEIQGLLGKSPAAEHLTNPSMLVNMNVDGSSFYGVVALETRWTQHGTGLVVKVIWEHELGDFEVIVNRPEEDNLAAVTHSIVNDIRDELSGTVDFVADPDMVRDIILTHDYAMLSSEAQRIIDLRKPIIAELNRHMDEWLSGNTANGKDLTSAQRADLLEYLGTQHKALFDELFDGFADLEAYPERPMLKLGGDHGKPTIWILGWRKIVDSQGNAKFERTRIHGHGYSEAVIRVQKGNITQHHFMGHPQAIDSSVIDFLEGQTTSIGTPYIHDMGYPMHDHRERLVDIQVARVEDFSVSIHLYDPPLIFMDIYDIKVHPSGRQELISHGQWLDDEVTAEIVDSIIQEFPDLGGLILADRDNFTKAISDIYVAMYFAEYEEPEILRSLDQAIREASPDERRNPTKVLLELLQRIKTKDDTTAERTTQVNITAILDEFIESSGYQSRITIDREDEAIFITSKKKSRAIRTAIKELVENALAESETIHVALVKDNGRVRFTVKNKTPIDYKRLRQLAEHAAGERRLIAMGRDNYVVVRMADPTLRLADLKTIDDSQLPFIYNLSREKDDMPQAEFGEPKKGLGRGLPYVRRLIVDELNGTILLVSNEEGTKVTLFFSEWVNEAPPVNQAMLAEQDSKEDDDFWAYHRFYRSLKPAFETYFHIYSKNIEFKGTSSSMFSAIYTVVDSILRLNTYKFLPLINPDGKDLTVYYPGAGIDIISVLGLTDASRIIMADKNASYDTQDGPVNFVDAILGLLKQFVGDASVSFQAAEEGQPARITFPFKGKNGQIRQRTIEYYAGYDASRGAPDDYDVLLVKDPIKSAFVGLKSLRPGGMAVAYLGGFQDEGDDPDTFLKIMSDFGTFEEVASSHDYMNDSSIYIPGEVMLFRKMDEAAVPNRAMLGTTRFKLTKGETREVGVKRIITLPGEAKKVPLRFHRNDDGIVTFQRTTGGKEHTLERDKAYYYYMTNGFVTSVSVNITDDGEKITIEKAPTNKAMLSAEEFLRNPTLESYRALPAAERQKIAHLAEETFNPVRLKSGHTYTFDELMNFIQRSAEDTKKLLLDKYGPEALYLSVGASWEWVYRLLEMQYPEYRGRFKYIAFSAGFGVTNAQLQAYLDYLTRALGNDIRKEGKIVITDSVVTGETMDFFVTLLKEWSEKRKINLSNRLIIHSITNQERTKLTNIEALGRPVIKELFPRIYEFRKDKEPFKYEILEQISDNTQGFDALTGDEYFGIRWTPEFRPQMWDSPDSPFRDGIDIPPSANAALMYYSLAGKAEFNQAMLSPFSFENDIPVEKSLLLPDWAADFVARHQDKAYPTVEERMEIAIELSRLNVVNQTGGPFGAAVFDRETGQLVSIGVNRVVPQTASLAHAEMMALLLAQERIQNFTLDREDAGLELVTSAQPCAMCFGAIPWSGVKSVVTGSRGTDVENITGFDEGPIHPDWVAELKKRGIAVKRDVLRRKANDVLRLYVESSGVIYNARDTDTPDEDKRRNLAMLADFTLDNGQSKEVELPELFVKGKPRELKLHFVRNSNGLASFKRAGSSSSGHDLKRDNPFRYTLGDGLFTIFGALITDDGHRIIVEELDVEDLENQAMLAVDWQERLEHLMAPLNFSDINAYLDALDEGREHPDPLSKVSGYLISLGIDVKAINKTLSEDTGTALAWKKKFLNYIKLIVMNDAKLKGLFDMRPVENGLLALPYVGYDMAVKDIINPDSRDIVGVYGAAGADLSNFLLSTNATEGYFIDWNYAGNEETGYYFDDYDEEEPSTVEDYRKWTAHYLSDKYLHGYATSNEYQLYHSSYFEALIFELIAMGVSDEEIQGIIDRRDEIDLRETATIQFHWAYPGEEAKLRTIHLLAEDTGQIEDSDKFALIPKEIDFYYLRAGITSALSGVPEWIARAVREGGHYVVDPYGRGMGGAPFEWHDPVPGLEEVTTVEKLSSNPLEYWKDFIVRAGISGPSGYGYNVEIYKKTGPNKAMLAEFVLGRGKNHEIMLPEVSVDGQKRLFRLKFARGNNGVTLFKLIGQESRPTRLHFNQPYQLNISSQGKTILVLLITDSGINITVEELYSANPSKKARMSLWTLNNVKFEIDPEKMRAALEGINAANAAKGSSKRVLVAQFLNGVRLFNRFLKEDNVDAYKLEDLHRRVHTEIGVGTIAGAGEKIMGDDMPIFEALFAGQYGDVEKDPYGVAARFYMALATKEAFDEGNRRAAIFMANYILMKAGKYPFVLTADKLEDYESTRLPPNPDALARLFESSQKDAEKYLKESAEKTDTINRAMLGEAEKGGIDFNAKHLNIKVKGESMEFNVPVNLQGLKPGAVEGLTPVIINIIPITNFLLILGLAETEDAPKMGQIPGSREPIGRLSSVRKKPF